MTRNHLLFIPGLGDRKWLYEMATPLWRRMGYQPHIYCFGWNDSADSLPEKQRALRDYVGALEADNVYVIGVSAGGPAAVNLLRDQPTIKRIVTVASPLIVKDRPTNELLMASVAETDTFLSGAPFHTTQKITSVHGSHDWRVPVAKSRRSGIDTVRLPVLGHMPTIAAALTLYCGLLDDRLAHAAYDFTSTM